jgi:dTDP-4-amino-4,6-dideoxygalactose transaminase
VGNHLIGDTEAITAARIRNALALDAGLRPLAPRVRVPERRPNERHVFHLYMFEAEDRDGLLAWLHALEIEAKIHYPVPLHLQPAGRRLGYREGDFPVAERQAKRIITLPVHQHLRAEQVRYMIDSVVEFYSR